LKVFWKIKENYCFTTFLVSAPFSVWIFKK
jgi:hypothetical protein